MIPIVRTFRPESAVNILLKHVSSVIVQAHYDNYTRIRFRADLVRDDRVFFGRVPSQHRLWRARGGCLISWRRVDGKEGENDAVVFAEAPKSMEGIYAAIGFTRSIAVVYVPPTWRPHLQTIAQRFGPDRPGKYAKSLKRLQIMRDVLETAPLLTHDLLGRLLSRQEPPPPLSSPGSPAAAAPPAGTAR